jgi:hypothetical protein
MTKMNATEYFAAAPHTNTVTGGQDVRDEGHAQ